MQINSFLTEAYPHPPSSGHTNYLRQLIRVVEALMPSTEFTFGCQSKNSTEVQQVRRFYAMQLQQETRPELSLNSSLSK